MRARLSLVASFALLALSLAACQTGRTLPAPAVLPGEAGYDVRPIGTEFRIGNRAAKLILVDDEYRLITGSAGEWGSGMFEPVWTVRRADIEWVEWIAVEKIAGLQMAFLSPEAIAVRYISPGASAR